LLHAEILSWSRSRGLFAGLSLEGATLRPDTEENQSLYGKDVTNKQILQGEVASPRAGRPLISALNRYSGGLRSWVAKRLPRHREAAAQ
jgi:SH3 domain-containing YSC84-like protein 1